MSTRHTHRLLIAAVLGTLLDLTGWMDTAFAQAKPDVRADCNGDGFDDLAIGAPGDDINGKNQAGSVNLLYGTAKGLSEARDQLWHQDVLGIEDAAEEGDNFGSALAAGDFNGGGYADLAVGVLQEAVGPAGGGTVNVLYGSASELSAAGTQLWHQEQLGVKGTAKEATSFGFALGESGTP
jgi:FG-GAP repeat